MCLGLNNIRNLLAIVVLLAAQAVAQVSTATLLGIVKDATGSSVPAATVTVKSMDTGLERTTGTDGGGNYTVPNLQPGRYQVAVTAPGAGEGLPWDPELCEFQTAHKHRGDHGRARL